MSLLGRRCSTRQSYSPISVEILPPECNVRRRRCSCPHRPCYRKNPPELPAARTGKHPYKGRRSLEADKGPRIGCRHMRYRRNIPPEDKRKDRRRCFGLLGQSEEHTSELQSLR